MAKKDQREARRRYDPPKTSRRVRIPVMETCSICKVEYKVVKGHRCKSPAGVDRPRFRPLTLHEDR